MQADIKKILYNQCKEIAITKIETLKEAISNAQNAANSETKSTAGDKHDTARAMMQLDVEQKSKQLAEAQKLVQTFAQFNPNSGKNSISLGSLVISKTAKYYISISLGKIEMESEIYYAVSAISPIAMAMMGKSKGDHFEINGNRMEVLEIF
jgi:transcription elongation GreA/GreB family factor